MLEFILGHTLRARLILIILDYAEITNFDVNLALCGGDLAVRRDIWHSALII